MNMTHSFEVELALRYNLVEDESIRKQIRQSNELAQAILNKEWDIVIEDIRKRLFPGCDLSLQDLLQQAKTHADLRETFDRLMKGDSLESQIDLLAFGVACLQSFVASNWTGAQAKDETSIDSLILNEALQLDGEEVVPVVRQKHLLLFARVILHEVQCVYSKSWDIRWWRLRYLIIHQDVLTEKSDQLYNDAIQQIATMTEDKEWTEGNQFSVHFHLEMAIFYNTYFDVARVKDHVNKATEQAGLEVKPTGVMGKRTKFQSKDLPQLTLDITKTSSDVDNIDNEDKNDLPRDLRLEDEVRLDKIKFSEERSSEELSLTQQAIVLGAFTMANRSQPKDELTNEELMPYLNAILDNSTCWSLKMSALLLRSKLEANERRTVERSMMQVQTLVDCLAEEGKKSRMRLLYASRLPPFWEVERTLVDLLMSLGTIKAALDIALRLQLWDDVIVCYHRLELRHKAAEVIRREIEKKETPRLYCMLGDATDEIEHYQKALELSENRSARAFRSLGMYHYYRKNYAECIDFFKKSLELSSFQLGVLLRLGFAGLEVQDWETAAQAYQKYCNYEPDNMEAWNNLANTYIKLGQKARAWKVLQEALKCEFDNWKLWDNIMVVSTDLAHFEEVIRAYHQVLDRQEKHVDVQVLEILVKSIEENINDNQGNPSSRYRKDALKLLGRLTSQVTNNGAVWELYSRLTALDGDEETTFKAVQLMQRALTARTAKNGWEKHVEECKAVIGTGNRLVQTIFAAVEKSNNSSRLVQLMASSKMSLKGVLAKVKMAQTSVQGEDVIEELAEEWKALQEALEGLINLINKVKGQ